MQRLKLLMKMFQLSGKELSELLFVDNSLVSKWCSGKRELKAGSAYLANIVELFMRLDSGNAYANITQLVSGAYPNVLRNNREDLSLCLKSWLLGDAGDEAEDSLDMLDLAGIAEITTVSSFKHNQGRRDAISFFEEYAAASDKALEVITYNTEDASWYYEDKDFSKKSHHDNLRFVERGGRLTIIHPLNTTYTNLAFAILNWIPIYLSSDESRGLYIPRYTEDPVNYTYFLIRGRLALTGMSTKNSKRMLTLMYTEKQIVSRIDEILQELISTALPLVYRVEGRKELISVLCETLYYKKARLAELRRTPKLCYSVQFPFLPLRRELVLSILSANGVSEAEAERFADDYERLTAASFYTETNQMINLSFLRLQLGAKRVPLDCFTMLLGRTVFASAKQYRELYAACLAEAETNPMMHLGLTDYLCDDSDLEFSVLAQRSTSVFFWDTRRSVSPVFIEEPKTVTAMYEYLEEKWNAIPNGDKDKGKLVKTLLAVLGEVNSQT